MDWCKAHQQDWNTVVVTEGTAIQINKEAHAGSGNRMAVLENLEMEDADFDSNEQASVVCWIPSTTTLDFGEGSKVIAIGRPSISHRTDQMTGEDRPDDIFLACFGMWAYPEFKVSIPETEPITEEDAGFLG